MDKSLSLPDLVIGNLHINPPIIQGGMGVLISSSRLASAVSNEGALGTVAAVGASENCKEKNLTYRERSYRGFRKMLADARALCNKPIAANIMCALSDYAELVKAAVDENIAAIISGAGLPLKLPELTPPGIKLIPIVSSARAASIICRTWWKKYRRLPDALVVEGSSAGGHLGFSMEEIATKRIKLETIVTEVLALVKNLKQEHESGDIPVIAAGGIFTGEDIARFLDIGAAGVQMGTRFVCTDECDGAYSYKQAYINCQKEDIEIIESPVGLPIRVIRNQFVDELHRSGKKEFRCRYHCLKNCNPKNSPYCIAEALKFAADGKIAEGLITCGANAYRLKEIVSVKKLIAQLVAEAKSRRIIAPTCI